MASAEKIFQMRMSFPSLLSPTPALPAKAAFEKRLEDETFFKPGDGKLVAEKICEDLGIRPAQLNELDLTKAQIHESRQDRRA